MMRLYYHPYSDNARRAVMTALSLNVPIELAAVDLRQGEQHAPAFLKLNPNHRVPVLVDDEFILWESHAIMQYLADKTPGQTVYPTDIRARADVNRWLFWCAQHLGPAVGILNREHVLKRLTGLGKADSAEVKRGEDLVYEFAGVLDTHLACREWICHGQLTLADLAIVTPFTGLLAAAAPGKLPISAFAHVQQWLARVETLDAWQKTIVVLARPIEP
ncbi:MAG: glutathione S-transferase family protein [Acidiferrobacter sp.]